MKKENNHNTQKNEEKPHDVVTPIIYTPKIEHSSLDAILVLWHIFVWVLTIPVLSGRIHPEIIGKNPVNSRPEYCLHVPAISRVFLHDPVTFPHLFCKILRDPMAGTIDLGNCIYFILLLHRFFLFLHHFGEEEYNLFIWCHCC